MKRGRKKGFKVSDETRIKMRNAKLGKKRPPQSEEWRRKISESHRGIKNHFFGKHHSDETKSKISRNKKGYKHTEEWKIRMSEICKIRGIRPPIKYGKDNNLYGRKGELSYVWRGGILESRRRYRKKNIEKYRFYNSQARKRLKKIIGKHTFGEWENLKAQYNWTCLACKRKEPEIKLTQDHIIPVTKGGLNNIENIQPLCGMCNSKKYNKIIYYNSSISPL